MDERKVDIACAILPHNVNRLRNRATGIHFVIHNDHVVALHLADQGQGHDVIIVDDEVDTGGSIAQAVNVVRENGARDIYLAFIHPIFSNNAAERLAELDIKHILTTDTIPISPEKMKPLEGRVTILSIAPMLGEVIRRAHEGRSVGEMFNE